MRNASTPRGITQIEIPQNDGDDPKTCQRWKVIDVPTEVLHHLQTRNRKHFGQAHGTPFTLEPYSTQFGFQGNTPSAEAVYDGTYDTTAEDDQDVRLLLHYLQKAQHTMNNPIPVELSLEAFSSKLRVWRESTSTSPSGLHLGHYKTMVSRHKFSDAQASDPARAELDQIQQELLTLHLRLINYALRTGYSYSRWNQVVNTMLLKEPGNYKIHRTRVIHIYEADYNLVLGLKWKEALVASEKAQVLNEGQYGSRPNRSAHDPVFLEVLQTEISRTSRKSLIQTNYDATSCYDRIIPSVAMMASKKFGIPSSVAEMNSTMLQNAEYKLRTDLGISETGYQHQGDNPIYGTGQGSGNSPMVWCFISSILFDSYSQRSHGAIYETPDKQLRTHIHMLGYVDDSNGQTNEFLSDTQPDPTTLAAIMQRDAQAWSDLLWASGGALELSKCSYQTLHWMFTPNGTPVLAGGKTHASVSVSDAQRHTHATLEQLSAHSAHKTLGHYVSPAGNLTTQYNILRQKSDTAAAFVANHPFTRMDTWTYYFAVYLPSIGYPLANSHFSKQQTDGIQRKALRAIISKCGYNRNTHRSIIFGSSRYGGANFRDLWSLQGIGQIKQFMCAWRSPESQKGRLLQIAVAWSQYSLGTGTPFLQDVHTELPHIECKWLASMRSFLAGSNGSLEYLPTYVAPLARTGDAYIMDKVLASNMFTASQIRQINYCRLYLQALLVSDLARAGGRHLDPYFLEGNRHHESSSVSLRHRVTQDRPNKSAWTLWKKANLLWSDSQGRMSPTLGPWHTKTGQVSSKTPPTRQWPAYLHDGVLYLRRGDGRYNVHFPCDNASSTLFHGDIVDDASFHEIPHDATATEATGPRTRGWTIPSRCQQISSHSSRDSPMIPP